MLYNTRVRSGQFGQAMPRPMGGLAPATGRGLGKLTGAWLMGTSERTLRDSTAYGAHGNFNGTAAMVVTDRGPALDCDGSSTCYVEVPTGINFSNGRCSFVAWFRATTLVQNAMIAGRHNASGSNSGFTMITATSGGVKFGVEFKDAGGTDGLLSGNTTLVANRWYLGGLTMGAANVRSIYLNGELESFGSGAFDYSFADQPLRFGKGVDTFWPGWTGQIGPALWFDSFLSDNDHKDLYRDFFQVCSARRDRVSGALAMPQVGTAQTTLLDGGSMWGDVEVLRRAARRRNVVYSLPGSWSIEAGLVGESITLDKYHAALALPPRPARSRQRNEFAVARGEYGDLPRPDAPDPLPALMPVWHTPLAQQARPYQADRRLLMQTHALGQVPAPEVVTADKWISEVRLPVRRARPMPGAAYYATDGSHLGDAEATGLDKFHAPLGAVLLQRRPVRYNPDNATIFQDEVFPQDPVAYTMPPWHVVMAAAARAVATRGRHEFYSDGGVLLGVPGLVAEAVAAAAFAAPFSQVHGSYYRRRTPPLPIGGIDLEPTQRVERVFSDALQAMGVPAHRARRLAPFFAATLSADTSTVVESPHLEAFAMSPDVRREARRFLREAWQASQGALLEPTNFAPPLIPRIRRWMLAAGFWRARY